MINYKIFYFISEFNSEHILKLRKNINLIFRNYEKKFDITYYKKIKNFCHSNGYKIYLSNNVNFAHNLGFDGVYIPAFNNSFIRNKNFRSNFKILGSAHNLKEIRIKELQGVNEVFLSPIFKNKHNKKLGIFRYLSLRNLTQMKDVALGGISKKNLKKFNLVKPFGFAGISFFK